MRLLIVEDDPDGREMLAELFRMHGWSVTDVPSTDAALVELRAGGFDVVISDENLEGASGSGMLREADAEGLLLNVGALMYTAEPSRLEVPTGVRILRKPLGITRLLDEAKAAAQEPPARDRAPTPVPISSTRPRKPVELVLYVTNSASSRRALGNLERVLDATHPTRVVVTVKNLADEAADEPSDSARASFTPLLVRQTPGQPERYLGGAESEQALAALIQELDAGPASQQAQHVASPFVEAPPSSRARR